VNNNDKQEIRLNKKDIKGIQIVHSNPFANPSNEMKSKNPASKRIHKNESH